MAKQKVLRYTVILDHDPRSPGYGVTVPDLPGCFSAGDDLEEALSNAQEAITAHLETLVDLGMDVPQGRLTQDSREFKEMVSPNSVLGLVLVSRDALLGNKKRVNVTLPANALDKFDAKAKLAGENRSSMLSRLMIDWLGEGDENRAH